MALSDILDVERVVVDTDGTLLPDKDAALRLLGGLLAPAVGVDELRVYQLLFEREALQTTGIGEGVAIPHASTEEALGQSAALLLSRAGVPFDAIDELPVGIIFGVVGPRKATGEHLRTLARISRLLRDAETRAELLRCGTGEQACEIIKRQDCAP